MNQPWRKVGGWESALRANPSAAKLQVKQPIISSLVLIQAVSTLLIRYCMLEHA
jgi:hypothetical protein